MAKSVKQQMYEQLANQHVQQALNNIGMQQFQDAYNAWSAEQDGLAEFQAAYNAWNNANPASQPTTQPVQKATQSIPVLNTNDFFKPKTASGIDVNAQTAKELDGRTLNEAYARQQQEEQILASQPMTKAEERKKIQQNVNTEDYFRQQQEEQKSASKADANKRERQERHKAFEELASQPIAVTDEKIQAQPEAIDPKESLVGNGINQLDLSQYNIPKSEDYSDLGMKRAMEVELENLENYDKAKQWIDPSYKMTKEEQTQAKKIAKEGIERLERPEGKNGPKRSVEDMTPEEQREYNVYKDLSLKTSGFGSYAVNLANALYRVGKFVLDQGEQAVSRQTVNSMKGQNSLRNTLGMEPLATQEDIAEWRNAPEEAKKAVTELDKQVLPVVQNAKTQHPVASGAGEFTGNVLMYYPTSGAIGALTSSAGLGAGATFAANQLLQAGQDEVLDVQPQINEMRELGYSEEEIAKFAKNRRLLDYGVNLGMGIAPEIIGGIVKNVKAKNAANAAFRANATEGAERLAKLANGEDLVDAAKVLADQTDDAAQAVPKLAKSSPVQNPVLSDEEISELIREANNEPDIPKLDSAEVKALNDEYSNMWTPAEEAAPPKTEPLKAEPIEAPKVEPVEAPSIKPAAEPVESTVKIKRFPVNEIDNPKFTNDEKDLINGAFFEIEEPLHRAKVNDAVSGLYRSVKSSEGVDLVTQYSELSTAFRNATDVEEAQAIADQLAQLKKSVNGIDSADKPIVKDIMDYNDAENAIAEYKIAINGEDKEAAEKAAKALDAARNRIARRKGSNAVLKETFGGNYGPKVKRPLYHYPDSGMTDEEMEELVNSWIENDLRNSKGTNAPAQNVSSSSIKPIAEPVENIEPISEVDDYLELKPSGKTLDQIADEFAAIEAEMKRNAKNISGVEQPAQSNSSTPLKMDLTFYGDENTVRHGAASSSDILDDLAGENAKLANEPSSADALWNELKAGEKSAASNAPVTPENPVAVDTTPAPKGKKLSKLYNTIQNTDKLTDAEKETFKNKNGFYYDGEVQKKLGAAAVDEVENGGTDNIYKYYMDGNFTEPLTGKDAHRMWVASADYNRLAKEASEEGYEGAAKLYTAKARNLMLEARFHGTSGGQFNAAFAYYARTPQGYIDKANDVLVKQLQEFSGKNPKLSSDIDVMAKTLSERLKDVDVDGIMSGTDVAAKENLRSIVLDSIESVVKKGSKQTKKIFKDLSAEELDNIINSKYQADLARNLDMFAMGSYGVRPATVENVLDIFADAEKYNINSKEYSKLEKKAFDLLINDLNSGKGKSFSSKFDTWRYLSMLFNPSTWTKNSVGNFANWGLTGTKNNIAALLEEAAERKAIADGAETIYGGRTKAILSSQDSGLIDKCAKDFDEFSYRAYKNGGNKWINVESELERAGDVFNNDKPIGKLLNKGNNVNNFMLGEMDAVAGKAKYKTSMAGFLKANGADESIFKSTDPKDMELLAQARDYALNSANEATFHTSRKLTKAVSSWIRAGKESTDPAYNIAARMLDFTVPFLRIPGNILRSCVDYSPISFLKAIAETGQWKKGVITTSKYIDDIAKGLTGTGLMVLGGALEELGLIDVSTGDGNLDTFNKNKGIKNASIPSLGGRRLSIAALAPGAMPVIWGAQAWKAIKDAKDGNKNAALDSFYNGLSVMGETLTDMTLFSGIAQTIEAARYSESKGEALTKVAAQVAANASSQVVPTLGRKIEQTIDDTARSTYSGQQSKSLKTLSSNWNYLKSKIPLAQEAGEALEKSDNNVVKGIGDFLTNEPAISGWGEEQKNQDYGIGLPGRIIRNSIDILNTTDVTANERDEYLKDLYLNGEENEGEEGEKDPNVLRYGYVTSSDANVKGYRMTEKEWTQYQKDSGAMRGEILDALMNNEDFMAQSKADQAKDIGDLKDFVRKYNQYKICGEKAGMELDSTTKKLYEAYESGGVDAVIEELNIKGALDAAGLKDAGNARAALDGLGDDGIKTYAAIKEKLNQDGTTSTESIKRELNKYKLSTEEKAKYYSYLDTDASPGANPYGYVPGINYNPDKDESYQKAKASLPTLDPVDYYKTRDAIDKLEKANGTITQTELVAYMNANRISESDMMKYWKAYGQANWKKVPSLENNTWVLPKK